MEGFILITAAPKRAIMGTMVDTSLPCRTSITAMKRIPVNEIISRICLGRDRNTDLFKSYDRCFFAFRSYSFKKNASRFNTFASLNPCNPSRIDLVIDRLWARDSLP